MKVHATIDPLWKSKKYKRDIVYRKISDALGIKCFHTGESDKNICIKVLDLIPQLFNNN